MTIQTDYEEIEKEIDKMKVLESGNLLDFEMNEEGKKDLKKLFKGSLAQRHLWELQKQKQTFIVENLKRINEMIELKKMIEELEYAEYNVTETRINALMRIYKKFDQLKADKQFLEEKQNGN